MIINVVNNKILIIHNLNPINNKYIMISFSSQYKNTIYKIIRKKIFGKKWQKKESESYFIRFTGTNKKTMIF